MLDWACKKYSINQSDNYRKWSPFKGVIYKINAFGAKVQEYEGGAVAQSVDRDGDFADFFQCFQSSAFLQFRSFRTLIREREKCGKKMLAK